MYYSFKDTVKPRRFILNSLTGFNDHLHNATNNRQNAFPNDHFNFFQRPLSLLHDELTTKMGKLTGNVPQRSHSFSVYTNRCIRLDGLAARCSARPKLPMQFVPVRNFEPRLFVPMPGNMGRPAFTFINLFIYCNLQRIINKNIHLGYVCTYIFFNS